MWWPPHGPDPRPPSEDKRGMEQQRMRQVDISSITDPTDMNLSKVQDIVEDRGAWCATVHESMRLQRVRHDLATNNNNHSKPAAFKTSIPDFSPPWPSDIARRVMQQCSALAGSDCVVPSKCWVRLSQVQSGWVAYNLVQPQPPPKMGIIIQDRKSVV